MTGGYLLALDAGTGSCRAALFRLDGSLAGLAQREWSHPPADGIPGSQSFDPAGNWALVHVHPRRALQRDLRARRGGPGRGAGRRLLQHGRRSCAVRPAAA